MDNEIFGNKIIVNKFTDVALEKLCMLYADTYKCVVPDYSVEMQSVIINNTPVDAYEVLYKIYVLDNKIFNKE